MNIALGVEYQGTNYCGWQIQKHCNGVQKLVQQAISEVANEPITIYCAGRTDSGVHAIGQVVNFITTAKRPPNAWIEGVNTKLPRDIRIVWQTEVDNDFNARFSATARQYRYVIYNNKIASAILANKVTWEKSTLNYKLMNTAAQPLLGEHDFSAFRASSCQAPHAKRNIQQISVSTNANFIFIDIKANAFLHHMVRNIAGSLIEVGLIQKNANWLAELLLIKDRTKAGKTAPADGLYFINSFYHKKHNIPRNALDNFYF